MVNPVIPRTSPPPKLLSSQQINSSSVESSANRDPFTSSVNPLRKFRTYSYQFIVFACKDMNVFNQISNLSIENNREIFAHAPDDDASSINNGIYRLKSIGKNTQTNGNDYAILINTTTDAELLINNVEMTNVIFQSPERSQQYGIPTISATSNAKMQILEPFSGDLIMILSEIATDLKVEPVGVIFGIKPFFVGHTDMINDDGSPASEATMHHVEVEECKAEACMLTDLVATLDSTGASYELNFVAYMNGVAQEPLLNSNKPMNFKTEKNATIESACNKLIQKINDQQIAQPSSSDPSNSIGVVLEIKFEDYFFDKGIINKHFKNLPLDNITNVQKDKEGIHIATTRVGIKQALHEICTMSLEFAGQAISKDSPADTQNSTNNRNRYLIRIDDSSVIVEGKMIITFIMKRQEVAVVASPKSPTEAAKLTNTQLQERKLEKDKLVADAKDRQNFLELDYIFSGRNVDILEFDIKIHYGLAAFYMWHAAKNPTSQQEATNTARGASGNVSGGPNQIGGTIPDVAPGIVPQTGRNARDPATHQAYKEFLRKFAVYDVGSAKVTIHGNPRLLNAMLRSPPATTNIPNINPAPKEIMANWDISPGLVQIHTYLPNKLWDPWGAQSVGVEEAFRDTPIWFDGIFQIISVTSKFNNGKFIQILELMVLPNEGSLPKVAEAGPSAKGTTPGSATDPNAKPGDTRTTSDAEAVHSSNLPGSTSKKRGIRNNNPGNIRKSSIVWKGQSPDQSGDSSFVIFTDPVYGIRAVAKLLLSYQKQGYNTINKILNHYAPSTENNTTSYITNVSNRLSKNPNQVLDLNNDKPTMNALVNAIIFQENGENPYPPTQVSQGVDLAYDT